MPKKKEHPSQVFQGRKMREESSLWDKMIFNYAKPLLDISMKERICFEQYGDLPDKLKIDHEIAKVEHKIYHHMKK